MRNAAIIICVCLFSGLLGGLLANALIAGFISDREDRPVSRRAPVWERRIITGPFSPHAGNEEREAGAEGNHSEAIPPQESQLPGN